MRTVVFLATLLPLGPLLAAENPPSNPPPDSTRVISSSSTTSFTSAVLDAPALRAARARVDAASARAASAGRLADLQLEGMYSQVRRPMGGEQYPMWEVSLVQPLPKAGERAADRARAIAVHAMTDADHLVMAGEMAADTAMALAESAAARERAALLEQQIERVERILAALDARLASGSGRVADRLALETRASDMRLMAERETTMADDALAEARGRLGLPPDAPLPAYSAPTTGEIIPDASPSIGLAAARADEARAMVRMARASTRPMTAIGLRFEREEERMGNMDTIGVAFMTDLPFRARGYARADTRAARAEESAALADAESARHRARTALSRVERAERLAETSRRLAGQTLARIDAEYDAFLRSAGLGGMDGASAVLMALELVERQTETRLRLVEADASVRVARAELWRHAPAALFITP